MMKSINNTNLHNNNNEEEYVKIPDMLQTIKDTLQIYKDEQNDKLIEQKNEIKINEKKDDIILDKIFVITNSITISANEYSCYFINNKNKDIIITLFPAMNGDIISFRRCQSSIGKIKIIYGSIIKKDSILPMSLMFMNIFSKLIFFQSVWSLRSHEKTKASILKSILRSLRSHEKTKAIIFPFLNVRRFS